MLAVIGCTSARSTSDTSDRVVDRPAAVQRLLHDLTAAARSGDRVAFDRDVATDATTRPRAEVWFANLRTLGPQLRLEALTPEAGPGVGTRARFQDRVWLQQVLARWQPAGARQPAEARVWLTVVEQDGRVLFAGDSDVPDADRSAPRPLWLQSAVSVRQRGSATVLAASGSATVLAASGSSGSSLDSWAARAADAAAAVRTRLPSWDGQLVVEIPATRQSFERSIGVADGSYARIGAAAWPRGERAATAAVHVVVNPGAIAGQPGEGLAVLLTHEAVHVAARSFASAAPSWLVEGYADQIAYQAHPATRAAALGPLRDSLRSGRLPTRFPPESAFTSTGAELDLAYAQAWSLCASIARRYGDAELDRLAAELGSGSTTAAGLRRLGTSEAELLRDWRAELDALT